MVSKETLHEVHYLLPQAHRSWQQVIFDISSDEEFERICEHQNDLLKFTPQRNKLQLYSDGWDINPDFDLQLYIDFIAQITLINDANKDWGIELDEDLQAQQNAENLQAFADAIGPIHTYWQASLRNQLKLIQLSPQRINELGLQQRAEIFVDPNDPPLLPHQAAECQIALLVHARTEGHSILSLPHPRASDPFREKWQTLLLPSPAGVDFDFNLYTKFLIAVFHI